MSEASMSHCAVCRQPEYACQCSIDSAELGYIEPGVPGVVAEAVRAMGSLPSELADDEYQAACVAALDAMPNGRAVAVLAVQKVVRELAQAHGWSDWVFDPATGKYPWE